MNALSTAGDFNLSNCTIVNDDVYTPTAFLSYWHFGSYDDPDGIITLHVVLKGIVIPVIAFIGIVANALNMVVLSKVKKLKRVPIYDLLLSMTAADLSIAVFGFVDCALFIVGSSLNSKDFNDRNLDKVKNYIVPEINTITDFLIFISHWNTTSVAAFRFVAVYFPLRAAHWCTPRRTRGTIICTIVASFLLELLLGNLIYFAPLFRSYVNEFNIFLTTVAYFVPWILSVVLVSLLLASLRSRTANGLATLQSRDRLRGERRQLTVLLTFTAAWFAVTTAPCTMYNVIYKVGYPYSSDMKLQLARLWEVGQFMLMLNYCGNFFFYSWINKCHRKQLRKLMPSCKYK